MNGDVFDLKLLGPLYSLVGKWRGIKGRNVAPDPKRGTEDGFYTEELTFTPIKTVRNHEQILYGLRYQTSAFENGEDLFHEEVGYWLWEPEAHEVYRCFIVPRGITVLAGGKVDPMANKFSLEARLGSPQFGISSIPFLDKEFKTIRYSLDIEIISNNEFAYKEITYLEMAGKNEIFEHLDQNTLKKIT